MDISISFAIISLAALIHASFQLSVSVLTLLSSRTIGAKKSHTRLLHLTSSFIFGVGTMTVLLLATIALILLSILKYQTPVLIWMICCAVLVFVSLLIWLFYYNGKKGTTLWIPRSVARYLTNRIKQTTIGAESFSLGLSSVLGELLFVIAPIFASALVLIQLSSTWQLIGIGTYTVISLLPLAIVWMLIGGGHSLSHIQKWRESNKRFLQFISGFGLIVLSFFIFVFEVLNATSGVL